MNAAKFTLTSTVLAAALGLALGLMSPPAAQANPADQNGCHTHKDCDGGGGGEPPTIVDTKAHWDGGIVEPERFAPHSDEQHGRTCVTSGVQTNGDGGGYVCEVDVPRTGNEVSYMLGAGVQTARKGDASLCDVFDGVALTPNSQTKFASYVYNWTDNCGDGSCTIQISNWFKSQETIDATEGKAELIILRARAEATGPFSDPNPFVDDLMLDVDEIVISFAASGSNKNIAVCEYSPDLGNLTVGDVTFHSAPTP